MQYEEFWDDLEEEIRRAMLGLGSGLISLSTHSWTGLEISSRSGILGTSGHPRWHSYQLEEALDHGFGGHGVISAAQSFLDELIRQIKSATDIKTVRRLAEPIIGPYSVNAGIGYGIAESLTGDAAALLGLVKLAVLAGLWERLKHPVLGMWEDPLAMTLALALRRSAWFSREATNADQALWQILEELQEVAKHPVRFVEIVGRHVKKDALKDWDDLKRYAQNPGILNDFQGGRIVGRALYQVVMMILLAMSVAGIAEKLAARFPWLMRLARILRQGGGTEELEGVEEGANVARGAEGAKTIPKEPPPKKPPGPETTGESAVEAAEKARRARRSQLAQDPAHGGKINAKTLREADVGLDLESQGELKPPITRDPNPAGTEFIDGDGAKWDIKRFNSNYPGKKGAFTVENSMNDIGGELAKGENVIVDTIDMSPADIEALRNAVNSSGLSKQIIFYPQ